MSQENVETVRRACEAWERGDLEEWLDMLHPEVVWDSSHFGGWMEGAIYRGRAEVRAYLVDEWRTAWPRYEARVEDVSDAEGRVLVLWWQCMAEKEGDIPLEVHTAQICSVRDERVIRMDNYADQHEALKAVGLEE